MAVSELRLLTLGRLALVGPVGEVDPSLTKRRRKLALLAVLALARRPMSRDELIEMFWGGQPEDRARHSLSNTLSHLRRVLGRDAVPAHGAEVELAIGDRLSVDAAELAEAVAKKDDAQTIALYGGPFLAGVYVDGSPSFEQWVAGERSRLEGMFLQAASRECLAMARSRRWEECAELSRRWLDVAPVSAEAALYRLNALKAPGTRDANQRAIEEFERIRERLMREYQLRPDKSVAALAKELLDRVASEGAAPGMTAEYQVVRSSGALTPASGATVATEPARVTTFTPRPSDPVNQTSAPPCEPADVRAPEERLPARVRAPRRRGLLAVASAIALVAVGGIAALQPWRARAGADSDSIPVVAIVDVDFIGRDTSNRWIAAGLAQMVATKLSRTRDLELIAPERVRQLRDRAQLAAGARLPPERAIDLARRVGASWAVTATVVDADTALQLDFTIRDVRSGSLVRTVSLGARNVLGLADAAATRLLDIAGSTRAGPQLAEAETPNVEAYQHYVRYLQALTENDDVAVRELDAAIALDSGFISALRARMNVAYDRAERDVQARLDAAFQRAAYRASDWDRLSIAASDGQRSGNWARAEATARALVERFPRDPRAYQWLSNVYMAQGRWRDAERAALAQLALDSLAATAGRGPCIPCQAYQDLASVQLGGLGDFAGAERTLRRLLELQPEVPGAWGTLSFALAAQQRYDEALVSVQRAIMLVGGAPMHRGGLARIMLMGRRYDEAEGVIKAMAADTSRVARAGATELTYLLQRERGQFAASVQTLRAILRDYSERSQLSLALAEGLARLGDYTAARRTIEGVSHTNFDATRSFSAPDLTSRAGDEARAFAWHHALLADATAPDADTTVLRALADSIEQIGARSYYGRDHLLHHHVRGLIAARAKRWGEAEERFSQARWGAWGWTRSVVEEARAQMAQSRPSDAIATLRRAYAVPLDAMGRYVPRSELDYWMTLAFRSAGQRDSATVYAARVRTAWSAADARVRVKLADLN